MKLVRKIEKPDEIKAHLQEISDFQVCVRLFTKAGLFISKGYFTCEFDTDGSLPFSPIPPNWVTDSAVACHYSQQGSTCAFQTRSLKVENFKLHLDLPESILFIDRRECFRIRPSIKRPIMIRLAIPEKAEMRLPASDISGGGFSVLVPARMNIFSIGSVFSIRLEISDEEKIECRVTVKAFTPFLNVTRIGFEFSDIRENDRSAVVSYCLRRELETRNALNTEGNDGQALNVCIVDGTSGQRPYSFLDESFFIKTIEPLNAIPHLRNSPPDLIVINTGNAGTRLVLQTVSKDPTLKEIPLFLLGPKSTGVTSRPGAVISIRTPYKNKYLLKTMKEFADNIRLSRAVDQSYWQYFSGEGRKIVIVDPQNNLSPVSIKALEGLEFQVQWVKGGEGIIGQIEAAQPDVLLLESEIGDMDPGTLCRLMNLNKTLKRIPKIRLLSGGDAPQAELFDHAGIHFLVKPLEMGRLVESIHRALGSGM